MKTKFGTALLIGMIMICLSLLVINAINQKVDEVNPKALEEVYTYTQEIDVSSAYVLYHLRCQGYSESEAKNAIAAAKVDWQQEAIDCAKRVIGQYPEISFQDLNDWLEVKGFTPIERLKAIEAVLGEDLINYG